MKQADRNVVNKKEINRGSLQRIHNYIELKQWVNHQ